jgi:hypothetical protein
MKRRFDRGASRKQTLKCLHTRTTLVRVRVRVRVITCRASPIFEGTFESTFVLSYLRSSTFQRELTLVRSCAPLFARFAGRNTRAKSSIISYASRSFHRCAFCECSAPQTYSTILDQKCAFVSDVLPYCKYPWGKILRFSTEMHGIPCQRENSCVDRFETSSRCYPSRHR